MGLDMFFERKRILSYHLAVNLMDKNPELDGLMKLTSVDSEEIYWRKFNALHKWFVDNVQEGNDNCEKYFVSIKNIEDILKILIKIKTANDAYKEGRLDEGDRDKICKDLLPPTEGFFFGNTDLDDYYFDGVAHSIEHFERILSEHKENKKNNSQFHDEYYYQSSW